MCGCGNAAQSGPIVQTWVATPNQADALAREFTDRTAADSYVAAFGGGIVRPLPDGGVLVDATLKAA